MKLSKKHIGKMMLSLALAGIALTGLNSSPALAAETVITTQAKSQIDFRQQAKELMNTNKNGEAYDLLKKNYASYSKDIEINFLLGVASYEIGKPEEAITYYKVILAQNSTLPRIRLELGRAYAAAGMLKEARQELEAVRATNPPAVVGENIKRFLSMLDEHKEWQIRLNLGYTYDTNVNLGPSTDANSIFSPGWQVSDMNKRSDLASTALLSIDNVKQINKNRSWQSNFTLRHTGYNKYSELTTDQFFLSSGPTFNEKKYVIALPVTYNYTAVNSNPYSRAYGIAPQIQFALSPKSTLIASISYEKRNYESATDRSGNALTMSIADRYSLNNTDFVQFGYRRTNENTQKNYLNNYADLLSIGYYKVFDKAWTLFVEPGICWNKYDGADPMNVALSDSTKVNTIRDDKQFIINFNLSKIVGQWQYALGYTYTKNDSNIKLYQYNRSQISLQASRVF